MRPNRHPVEARSRSAYADGKLPKRTAIRPSAARRGVAVALLATATVVVAGGAQAEPAPRLSDAEVSRRLAFIEARLERGTRSAALWWYAWYFGYMTVTIGQAGFALAIKDRGLRTDTAVGAAFSSVGVLGLGAFDFPPRHAAGTLGAWPESTPDERRRKLAKGERLLAASARSEVVGRSWIPHVAGIGLSLTSSLVLALAYKRVVSGIVTLLSGVAITEAQVFTRPTAAIDDWRAYQQGSFGGGAPKATRGMPFSVIAQPGGAGLALAF